VFGARGVRGKGKGGKWEGHELKKLTGKLKRSEGREEAPAFATAAARWRSAGARAEGENGMASAGRARREGARATRGGEVKQEVARGGRKRRAALSVFNRLRTEGYAQGGRFWVRERRDQELEGTRNTKLRQVWAARCVIPYVL
jgi:hypothetical protein